MTASGDASSTVLEAAGSVEALMGLVDMPPAAVSPTADCVGVLPCNTQLQPIDRLGIRLSDSVWICQLDAERTRRIAALFASSRGTALDVSLCETCVEILHVEGAGVSIMSGRNSGPVCSSSEQVRQLEDLQFSLGEGPCHDAYTTGTMVAEPDLANSANNNWPNYTPPALDLGACAVFAFPLRSGVDVVGVLTVYDTVGMLTGEQIADGSVLAHTLPEIMSAIQAQAPQPLLASELSDPDAHRAEVHQASGMTAVQLGIGVEEALVRIRANAYATSQTVAHVATEIVAHRLHLGDDGHDDREPPNE